MDVQEARERAAHRWVQENGDDLEFARHMVKHSYLGARMVLNEQWRDLGRTINEALPPRLRRLVNQSRSRSGA
jgi:hypothetical protein